MTLEKARKILGKEGELYSDDEVLAIINKARILALACVNKIEAKKASNGIAYFTNKAYLEVK